MVKKNCADCGVLFEYEPNPNFPDKRKYCDECSATRKANWEAKQGKPKPSAPITPKSIAVEAVKAKEQAPREYHCSHHDIVISRTEKPHSYEFGSAGNRHKIYYAEVAELLAQIEALKECGLYADLESEIKTQKF